MTASRSYQPKYSNSWAMVIGINQYRHVSPLGYATNDATAVANILTKQFGFPKNNVTVLLDDEASIAGIRAAFMAYANADKIQPDDRLLVFFAGHGHTVAGSRGEVGFLVPVDGQAGDLNTLIRWDELTRNAELIPAKHLFFLMDACYGGLALQRAPAFGNMRFLGDMLQRHARQVLTAGKADETVADGNGVRPGHSIFTAHLLNALEGSASTEEGIITANGVMAYVYDRVARDQYSHQTPHYGFVEGDGDFVFDTSILDDLLDTEKSKSHATNTPDGAGAKDILINTSPQVVVTSTNDVPVVVTMKELLSDPSKRIKLDDFVFLHVRRLLDAIDLRHFPTQSANFGKDEFVARINAYEEATKDMQRIVILLARWGNAEQLSLLERTFTRLAEADKGSGGLVLWLKLSWYPILYLMYSAGIASLATGKYEALRTVLQTPVHGIFNYPERDTAIVLPVMDNLTEINDAFKQLPGHEKHYVPRSEHLFTQLQPELEDLLFLGKSYETLFDDFEVLLALTYLDLTDGDWGPIGRFGWKQRRGLGRGDSPFSRTVDDAKKAGSRWGPLQAGFFQSSEQRFLLDAQKFGEMLKRLPWF